MLKSNTTLHTLNLDNNSIGAEGVIEIAKMLELNSTLRMISMNGICNNNCTDGAIGIAKMLSTNCTLHTLEFACNRIGSDGAI